MHCGIEVMHHAQVLDRVFEAVKERQRVRIEMPRFSAAFEAELTDVLQKLGIHEAFTDEANFRTLIHIKYAAIGPYRVTTPDHNEAPGKLGLDIPNEKPPVPSLGRGVESPSRNIESSESVPYSEESRIRM
ncbi:hypothetical protein HPB51_019864 [Rhipicephalus microplus]|uniref:Serpin domain-containing protein n=1 Tax=Rhipicephalus microplus TaxID=6941 RepID=A0A9J6D6T5_RHIMP|nr:hypothetical protein HPB51_019864 [Rhipicephalus microplus]